MGSLFKQPGSRTEEVEHLTGLRRVNDQLKDKLTEKDIQQLLALTKQVNSPSLHNIAYALANARFSPEQLQSYMTYANNFEVGSEPYNRYMRLVLLGRAIVDPSNSREMAPQYKHLVEVLRSEKVKAYLKSKYDGEWNAGGL
jgi:ABC-type metal ion transport system substrate-binding protein